MGEPIYVETRIRGAVAQVWELSQEPSQHSRWDLRFGTITYLPRPDPRQPQDFRYALGFGPLVIDGVGRSLGERAGDDGRGTSVLGFWSDHPLSLIARGKGYWRYVPTASGVRFLTGYDYAPRWGRLGELIDDLAFRPAIGWGTAWSFDRLRLWIERGQTPERSLQLAAADVVGRSLVAAVVVGGVVPRTRAKPVLIAAAVLAVQALPRPARVPSARRCLRRAPDALGASEPDRLAEVAA
ncbi:hypothetical protein ACMYYO_09890 [Dermacoccaceae bacterium W4C1]